MKIHGRRTVRLSAGIAILSTALAVALLLVPPSLRAVTRDQQPVTSSPGRLSEDSSVLPAHHGSALPSGRASQSPQSEPSIRITPSSIGGRAIGRAPTPGANEQTSVQISGHPVWCTDARTGNAFEYQAQHLFSSGLIDATWAPDSTQLCLGSAEGVHDLVVPDGSGGAYVAWVDARLVAPDIYLTRFTASGSVAAGWPDGGLPVCSASLSQYNLDACADGAGGVILAWQDFRSGHSSEIYVERVGADHAPASGWADGGVPAANGAPDQYSPRLVSDGAGGAFVIWQSRESGGLGARMQH
ncbi:MAG: hypothetical protein ACRDL7_13540, partial [Gaiellaceae bacterium]